MAESGERSKNYGWVKDIAGHEWLCPADVLRKREADAETELKDCIDVEALKPYLED